MAVSAIVTEPPPAVAGTITLVVIGFAGEGPVAKGSVVAVPPAVGIVAVVA